MKKETGALFLFGKYPSVGETAGEKPKHELLLPGNGRRLSPVKTV